MLDSSHDGAHANPTTMHCIYLLDKQALHACSPRSGEKLGKF